MANAINNTSSLGAGSNSLLTEATFQPKLVLEFSTTSGWKRLKWFQLVWVNIDHDAVIFMSLPYWTLNPETYLIVNPARHKAHCASTPTGCPLYIRCTVFMWLVLCISRAVFVKGVRWIWPPLGRNWWPTSPSPNDLQKCIGRRLLHYGYRGTVVEWCKIGLWLYVIC